MKYLIGLLLGLAVGVGAVETSLVHITGNSTPNIEEKIETLETKVVNLEMKLIRLHRAMTVQTEWNTTTQKLIGLIDKRFLVQHGYEVEGK